MLAPLEVALAPIEHGVTDPRHWPHGTRAVTGMVVAMAAASGAIGALRLGDVFSVQIVAGAVVLTAAAAYAGAFAVTRGAVP